MHHLISFCSNFSLKQTAIVEDHHSSGFSQNIADLQVICFVKFSCGRHNVTKTKSVDLPATCRMFLSKHREVHSHTCSKRLCTQSSASHLPFACQLTQFWLVSFWFQ